MESETNTNLKTELVKEVEGIALSKDDMAEVDIDEVIPRPVNDHEEIQLINERIDHLTQSIDSLFSILKDIRNKTKGKKDFAIRSKIADNKTGLSIPEGTELMGTTHGVPYFLIAKSGKFYIGTREYPSLSAAAEGISGVRRSGWTFWKLPDGRTVKEAFKDQI